MGKFDELIIKAKDLAGVAGSKAQEVAAQAKLRMQITQMKSQIDANYLKLGEIIYELNKSGTQNEELVGMCVAEIETQLAELAELKDKLDEMRKVLRCPDCMSENPRDALYCSHCGASLKGQSPTAPEDSGEVNEEAAPEETAAGAQAPTAAAIDEPKE